MNGFDFKAQNATRTGVPIIPLFVLSLLAVSLVAAADLPKTLGSDDSTSPTRTGDWVQEGFDPGHTAFNRFETILSPENVGNLVKLWESPVGSFFSKPVVWHGKVYIGSSGDGQMQALDAATGATLWVGPGQGSFFNTSPAVRHGLVFANAFVSPFLAYDAETGEIAWNSGLDGSRGSPTLQGQGRTLYFCDSKGTLHALDVETGAEIWSRESDGSNVGQAPVVLNGRVFQMKSTSGSGLTAYDAQTGQRLWNRPDAGSAAGVAAAHGMLFYRGVIEGGSTSVIALDAATGELIWETPSVELGSSVVPAVAYGKVFVNVIDLVALDARTGVEVWRRPLVHANDGPSVANGVVYSANDDGEWDAFDVRDGSLLWSVNNAQCSGACIQATPVVANGRLYLADGDAVLRAYGLPP
jgi:outer membrane protein assembly factor BamB